MRRHIEVSIDDGLVTINGEEVTHPGAKAAVWLLAVTVGILLAVVSVFVMLPILGVAVTLFFGFVAAFAIALATTALLLAFGWPLLLAFLVLVGIVKQASRRR
jgi:hypothetical protein